MKLAFLGGTLGFAIAVSSQVVKKCPSGNVCFSINVPETTASSGSGDLYFQIQGPASKQWIGLGQGGANQMRNSNIFIIYADSTGSNVTLSPRLGNGEFEPDFNADAQVSLLEGSGIANGVMTANVRCSGCNKWATGTMDLTSSSTTWIWAYKNGSPLGSNSPSASLDQHDANADFQFNLADATGGNSLNPFAVQAAGGASTGVSAGGASTGSSAGVVSTSTDGGSSDIENEIKIAGRAKIAHGTIMGLTFVIIYPLGAILIRLLSFSGLVWVHAATQIFAYILALTGLGLGVYIALKPDRQINNYHPIIGIVVIVLLAIQPVLGQLHHAAYVRQGKPGIWTLAHVALGRTLITLGIINGGLGLRLSGNTRNGEIAYGVVAGMVWITWMAIAVIKGRDSRKGGQRNGEKILDSPASQERERSA